MYATRKIASAVAGIALGIIALSAGSFIHSAQALAATQDTNWSVTAPADTNWAPADTNWAPADTNWTAYTPADTNWP
jgi:hypothetical protein